MKKLSKHFTRDEFEDSQWAARRNKQNKMDHTQLDNAIELSTNVLEQIREKFGPTIISSGFRSMEVNRGIGGSTNSQHTYGEAADIKVIGHNAYEVADWITEESDIEFDQCIYEYGAWVHISFTKRYANRNQVLTIDSKGRRKGLHI